MWVVTVLAVVSRRVLLRVTGIWTTLVTAAGRTQGPALDAIHALAFRLSALWEVVLHPIAVEYPSNVIMFPGATPRPPRMERLPIQLAGVLLAGVGLIGVIVLLYAG